MGYSVNVVFKSKAKRDRILVWFQEQLSEYHWSDIRGPTDDPAYAPKRAKYPIGIDYHGFTGNWVAWNLIHWLARKCGHKRFNYDGYENFLVADTKVDKYGVIIEEGLWNKIIGRKNRIEMRDVIAKLEREWPDG